MTRDRMRKFGGSVSGGDGTEWLARHAKRTSMTRRIFKPVDRCQLIKPIGGVPRWLSGRVQAIANRIKSATMS